MNTRGLLTVLELVVDGKGDIDVPIHYRVKGVLEEGENPFGSGYHRDDATKEYQ